MILHAPYSVSNKLMQLVKDANSGISSIHNQESQQEDVLFKTGKGDFLKLFETILHNTDFFQATGLSSLHSYLHKMNVREHLILVHNTFSSKDDIQWAQQIHPNLYWCACPSANLYIENAIPNVDLWHKNQLTICIGTDSLASNNQLSILEEVRILGKHFPTIPLSNMLNWATLNGAKALKMSNVLGSFTKDKKPGIVQIANMTSCEILPESLDIKRLW
jgi:aminodeoxyfutalosine deaminase